MNKIIPVLTMSILLVCMLTTRAAAQSNSLPLGTLTVAPDPVPCSTVLNGSLFLPGMSCYTATISNCPNTQPIGITFGWKVPSGPVRGTIVMFSGSGGRMPSEYADDSLSYASTYATNYIVVQAEYDSDWENPNNSSGGSILNAACRPATFLNYINSHTLYHPTGTPMCAQGSSAGSGAISYALTWYGASSYLKNVELLNGPVFSEVDQGCTYPNALSMNVCGTTGGVKQYGCTAATTAWNDDVIYIGHYANQVSTWSGLPNCGTSLVNPNDYTTWAAMSIVDGSSGSVTPTFNYPTTTMHGWVCAPPYKTCNDGTCPNNSASQGNYYYRQFSNSIGPVQFKLTGVTKCTQEEGIGMGFDPDSGKTASTAITLDMNTQCQP